MKYLPRLSIAAAVITTTFICKVQAAAVDDYYYGADAPSFNIVEDNFQGIQPHDILEEKPAMEKPGKKQKQRQQKDDKNDDGPHPIVKIKGPDDYCFFLPPGPDMEVAPNEKIGVPYCTRRAVVPGNRVFPKGFVTVAHYEEADNFVQVTGYIDSSKAGLIPNDQGGQYDNHGEGKPIGAECAGWNYFVNLVEPADNRFCIRCCNSKDDCNPGRSQYGCMRVVPGDYTKPDNMKAKSNENKEKAADGSKMTTKEDNADDKDESDKDSQAENKADKAPEQEQKTSSTPEVPKEDSPSSDAAEDPGETEQGQGNVDGANNGQQSPETQSPPAAVAAAPAAPPPPPSSQGEEEHGEQKEANNEPSPTTKSDETDANKAEDKQPKQNPDNDQQQQEQEENNGAQSTANKNSVGQDGQQQAAPVENQEADNVKVSEKGNEPQSDQANDNNGVSATQPATANQGDASQGDDDTPANTADGSSSRNPLLSNNSGARV
ncbi:hypothetical protein VTP01DRAFT_1319 [Rhizomucor pusillus]|uniref:uncharacterized protein n=1 Tax=Rhizomucor pusillus TaxID=4840 RepID=UPI0037432DA3